MNIGSCVLTIAHLFSFRALQLTALGTFPTPRLLTCNISLCRIRFVVLKALSVFCEPNGSQTSGRRTSSATINSYEGHKELGTKAFFQRNCSHTEPFTQSLTGQSRYAPLFIRANKCVGSWSRSSSFFLNFRTAQSIRRRQPMLLYCWQVATTGSH